MRKFETNERKNSICYKQSQGFSPERTPIFVRSPRALGCKSALSTQYIDLGHGIGTSGAVFYPSPQAIRQVD